MHCGPSASRPRGWSFWWKPILFLLVAAIGLYYVKWSPYYFKSLAAAETHSIGASILADNPASPVVAALVYAEAYFLAIWKAALLAVILGSLMEVLIPRDWLLRLFGKSDFASTLRGGLLAFPGMMCSCCAAPVAVSMRRQRASVGAALAFWIANPVLNPATLVFMGFVLGWDFALLRLTAGLVLVFGASWLAQRIASPDSWPEAGSRETAPAGLEDDRSMGVRWAVRAWQLFRSALPVYVLAVLALGAARVWILPYVGDTVGNSFAWLVLLAIAGTLFVIPTAAEIPIVQAMLTMGLGAGPAAALLMTLPSISLPSLLMLRKSVEDKVLVTVALLTVLIGVASGLLGAFFLR